MALLTKIDAAIAFGVSMELLDWFIKNCPKHGDDRRLKTIDIGGVQMIEEDELDAFRAYLRKPWPVNTTTGRPSIPGRIKADVKQESHLACAICGHMDNGEVAHIEAVKKTYNNSPENLIFLCPNHHTKFDLGFRPASNVSKDEVQAAKLTKRQSRARIMRVEADVTKAYATILALISKLKKQIDEAAGSAVADVYLVEITNLLKQSSEFGSKIAKASKAGKADTELQKHLREHAPRIAKLSIEGLAAKTPKELKAKVSKVVEESHDVLEALDEVDCPHCGGRGTTGLVGDWCKFCRGSQQISSARAEAYNPQAIDEETCPHCDGTGTTGLVGEFCAYCRGSQVVSGERAGEYASTEIDEALCPLCCGRGTTGLLGEYCQFCQGSCVVPTRRSESFDVKDLDIVECPRCAGKGITGLASDYCRFCKGSQLISRSKADTYDEQLGDEVECPHCYGHGTVGLNGTYCSYCKGSQLLSQSKADAYDPDDLDEVECPRCEGTGITGYVGDQCKLCKGEQRVKRATAQRFSHGRRRE